MNRYITVLWALASFGLLVGFIASVADFGYNANLPLQAAVAQGAGAIGVLSLVGGLVASAIVHAITTRDES